MALPLLLVGAAALASVAALGAASAAPDPLARHRWTSRLLVVVAPQGDDPRVAEQRRLFAAAGRGSSERDLSFVEAIGDGSDAVAIRGRFGIPAGQFAAILVGKDGGAKLRSGEPIPASALFAEIDAMPMRRSEIRERSRP